MCVSFPILPHVLYVIIIAKWQQKAMLMGRSLQVLTGRDSLHFQLIYALIFREIIWTPRVRSPKIVHNTLILKIDAAWWPPRTRGCPSLAGGPNPRATTHSLRRRAEDWCKHVNDLRNRLWNLVIIAPFSQSVTVSRNWMIFYYNPSYLLFCIVSTGPYLDIRIVEYLTLIVALFCF